MVVTGGTVKRKPEPRTASMKASRNCRARETNQQLLPGIPDDITITNISPKLSWVRLRTLAVVSRGWLQALRNGKIFEARVSAKSTETMFVYCVGGTKDPQFTLYSVEDDSVYSLPPIPGIDSNNSANCTHTSVNGRLYAFGATKEEFTPQIEKWRRHQLYTYEYDLARHGGWRQCANPKFFGIPLQSVVMNGVIFVHGTWQCVALYDPNADVWSPIITVPPDHHRLNQIMRYGDGWHQKILAKILAGAGIAEDLVYQYGRISNSFLPIKWITNFSVSLWFHLGSFFSFPCSIHIENAEQEVKIGRGIAVVTINGNFFKLTRQHIDAYDSRTNTWTPLHFEGPFEFLHSDSTPEVSMRTTPRAVDVAVVRNKNEMYSVVERWSFGGRLFRFLMKSEISEQGNKWRECSSNQQNGGRWKQLECSAPFVPGFLSCPVQL